MALTIKVGGKAKQQETPQEEVKKDPQATVSMNIKKSLDGNFMIFDHPEIDIAVLPETKKVVTFAKEKHSKHVYEAQDRLFSFLRKRGVIQLGSVQGGNVYNSLEAIIPESKVEGVDATQSVLYNISRFLEEEKPYYEHINAYHDQLEDELVDPDAEHSTELGEVPQEETKGSIFPGMAPYGLYYEYR
jgi:hypothetical protein